MLRVFRFDLIIKFPSFFEMEFQFRLKEFDRYISSMNVNWTNYFLSAKNFLPTSQLRHFLTSKEIPFRYSVEFTLTNNYQ